MSNYSTNSKAYLEFEKELQQLGKNAQAASERVLTRSVNEGLTFAKQNTPTVTGWLKKSWYKLPTHSNGTFAEARLMNNASYALYWNEGHRLVRNGVTIGFVEGSHVTDKIKAYVEKRAQKLMAEEVRKMGGK